MNLAKKIDAALLRVAAGNADDLRDGVKKSIDVNKAVDAWIHDFGFEYTVTPKQARDWAHAHIIPDMTAFGNALDHVYANGWIMGGNVATAYYAKLTLSKAAPSEEQIRVAAGINWDTWKPGHAAAAALVRPAGGLHDLLNRTKPTTIQGVSDTTLDRIGTVLARGFEGDAAANLAGGQGKAFMAGAITEILGDPQRALMIAQTEMSRALNTATMDSYNSFGVEWKEWVALEECPLCAGNVEDGVIPIDQDFSSGDSEPPAHPNCRCTIAPANPPESSSPSMTFDDVVGGAVAGVVAASLIGNNGTVTDGTDMIDDGDLELAVSPDRVKGVPGPLEVARALSRLAILPNPDHPDLAEPEKYCESPWPVVPLPLIDPNAWDDAVTVVVDFEDLFGTDPFLKRKNVRKHIEAMGQAVTPFRSYALIAEVDGKLIIIDGHHRLMATWLLGQNSAAAYKIVIP